MNISGTLNVFKLLWNPTLCLPQHTVSTFNHLPIPLSKAFPKRAGKDGEKEVDIQAVVLDKDNCFAVPHTDEVYEGYKVWFSNLWFCWLCIFFASFPNHTLETFFTTKIYIPISYFITKFTQARKLTISGPLPASPRRLPRLKATYSIQHSRHKLRPPSQASCPTRSKHRRQSSATLDQKAGLQRRGHGLLPSAPRLWRDETRPDCHRWRPLVDGHYDGEYDGEPWILDPRWGYWTWVCKSHSAGA
jgi:hypothetical protein